ncbi:unnamed protein product [Paramecium primaurelia]|uniref:Uncharacterized protein n=1 Tax=Paramecium primaurelia TaxID=5886 RepID=A0A8S1MRX2_PARPR|nr:unnamed protein product [Paramecium primaurelia]
MMADWLEKSEEIQNTQKVRELIFTILIKSINIVVDINCQFFYMNYFINLNKKDQSGYLQNQFRPIHQKLNPKKVSYIQKLIFMSKVEPQVEYKSKIISL